MNEDQAISTSRSLSVLNFLIGVWLIISPYILTYTTAQAKWEQTAAGVLVAIFAGIRYFAPQVRWLSWVNVIIAAWLIIAPYVTNYQATAAFWNEVIAAVVLGILAIWNAGIDTGDIHHHAMQ